MAAQDIVRTGIAQSPEGRHCFARMTVRENLELGAYLRRDNEIADDLARVYEFFPRLEERERQKAGTMSGGEQQMLAIGRALMANPKLLLLDEPGMGLAPILVERIYETIREINQQGTTVLLVEQNANAALEYIRATDPTRNTAGLEAATGLALMMAGDRGKRIDPARGGVSPEIERSVVDLPAPFEPISVTISPSSTSSETPLSASMLP